MRDVFIIGSGQTPVTRGRGRRAHELAADAIQAAIVDAAVPPRDVSALYLGNMLAGILEQQMQLAAYSAHSAGLNGIEALTIEASCGSGAAALHAGFMAVAGGFHNIAVVCGAEQMSHTPSEDVARALATASDWPVEGGQGQSFVALNASLMRRYAEAYGLNGTSFAPFSITAHRNGVCNPNALLRNRLDIDGYLNSRMLVEPMRIMDAPPICDGAAAVILADGKTAAALHSTLPHIRIRASAVATDVVGVGERLRTVRLPAAERSSREAYEQAGMAPEHIDLFELHDAFTVISALSLEAAGFARRGEATRMAADGELEIGGRLPIATMGGLKARGHPVGASGVYQVVEAAQQLTGSADRNQVSNAEVAMTQNIGGSGATVVTHILTR